MTIRAPHFTVQLQWLKPWDPPWRNVNILNAAQLQVFPVGEALLGLERPFPPVRQLDFQFRNLCLLNAAQRLVFPVGEAIDETVPAKLTRSFDIQFPNITARPVPAAMPFSPEIFDRPPQPYRPPADFQFVNLVLGAVTPPDLTKIFRPPLITRQQAPTPPVDFQSPNLAVKVSVVPMRPIGGQLLDQAPPLVRQLDFQFRNLCILNAAQRLVFPVGEALDESKPAVLTRPFDIQPTNIPILAAAQAQVHPVGAVLDESKPALSPQKSDLIQPNLLLIQPVAQLPRAASIFEHPPTVQPSQDFIAPNLLISTIVVTYEPAVAVWGPWPQRPVPPLDFQFANITLSASGPPTKPQGKILDEITPRVDPRQLDFQFPNVVLTNFIPPDLTKLFRPPLITRRIATSLPVDAPIPNLLTTTLSVVAAKPPFNFIFERPALAVQPRDAAPINLLPTLLQTAVGKPPVANFSLFADRPSPQSPPWDQAPVNMLVFKPPPPPPSAELHQNPMFITMGRLSQLGNLPS